jgi:carbon storage regulator
MEPNTSSSLKGQVNNMLILNRKPGESIIINGNIEIRILEMADGKLKIGIEAPRNVNILRKEVFDQVVEENKNAIGEDHDILSIIPKK